METISQRELRNDNARVIARVEAGETLVVTRRGVPVADLAPHESAPGAPTFAEAATVVDVFADLPALDVTAWVDDVRATDEVLDDDASDAWQDV